MTNTQKAIFWLLSWTWGLPVTLLGAVIALGLIIAGFKPKTFHTLVCFEVGEGWGGFGLGLFFVIGRDAAERTKRHEAGHGVQNAKYGLLTPFIVSIPSFTRYWWFQYQLRIKGKSWNDLPSYHGVWFEREANEFGDRYFGGVGYDCTTTA